MDIYSILHSQLSLTVGPVQYYNMHPDGLRNTFSRMSK